MINICPRCKGIIGKENICPKCGVNIIDFKEERDTKIREIANSLPSESDETEEVFSVKEFCHTCQEWQYSTENSCPKCGNILLAYSKDNINFEVEKDKNLYCPKCKEWHKTAGAFCEMCGTKMYDTHFTQGKTTVAIFRRSISKRGILALIMLGSIIIFAVILYSKFFSVSKEDRTRAQVVATQIGSIDSVTLENADELYNIYKAYNELTTKQQRLVKNSRILLDMMSELEQLIEITNDPTNSITKSELTGIWKEESTELHIGYFYFTSKGQVYYLAARVPISESDFTSKYRLSESYSLNDYNKVTRAKDGEFFNSATVSNGTFSVTKDSSGILTMEVKCGSASGTYKKTSDKVNTAPLQCEHPNCLNKAAETGDSHYCEEHSNKCLECNKYIDEDALYCVNCILKALNSN